MTIEDFDDDVQVDRTLFHLLKGRAVRSARLTLETLCEHETLPGPDGEVLAWDTQRLQAGHVDVELVAMDLLDLHDALLCLDRLQLLARPLAQRPHLVMFRPEIEAYSLHAAAPPLHQALH